jgi:hypothetical protein
MAQVISHLPLTVEAQAQIKSHASPCGICGEPSGTGFILRNSVFLLSPFHQRFILVHSLITDIQSQQLMALLTFSVISSQFLNTQNQITVQFKYPFSTFLFHIYIFLYSKAQIFQEATRHLKIPGARRVT